MKLNEVEKPWERTKKLLDYFFVIPNYDYEIDEDGRVVVNHACRVSSHLTTAKLLEKLPVNFLFVKGTFTLSETYLTTLEGCPKETGNSFLCNHCNITSLVGGPKIVRGNYEVINCPLNSLDGLPDEIWGRFTMSLVNELPLLRLLSVKGLKEIEFDPNGHDSQVVSEILNKYLGDPSKGNIIKCAAELSRAGFKEWARR